MVEIDDNAKNASTISSYTRVNGPIELQKEPVKAGIDVFHAAKAMGKHVIKVTGENVTTLEKFFKPLCKCGFNVADVNMRINEMLSSKTTELFEDITSAFTNFGATAWRGASETPASMRAFAEANNLVDSTHNFNF